MGNTNLNIDKYRRFWERIMTVSLIPGEVDNKYILDPMAHHFHKQPICLYDLEDFHMEFRVFSLDDLFTRLGEGVSGKDITKELNRFIEITNTLMTNVIDRFNNFFKEEVKGIPEFMKQTYMEFFLMDKEYRPGNKEVKKRFDYLIGIDKPKKKVFYQVLKLVNFQKNQV